MMSLMVRLYSLLFILVLVPSVQIRTKEMFLPWRLSLLAKSLETKLFWEQLSNIVLAVVPETLIFWMGRMVPPILVPFTV